MARCQVQLRVGLRPPLRGSEGVSALRAQFTGKRSQDEEAKGSQGKGVNQPMNTHVNKLSTSQPQAHSRKLEGNKRQDIPANLKGTNVKSLSAKSKNAIPHFSENFFYSSLKKSLLVQKEIA